MNSKTILSLYNGDYSCIERPIPKNSKYDKALSKCTGLQEKLAQLVDKETFSLIEKVLEYQSELSAIEMDFLWLCLYCWKRFQRNNVPPPPPISRKFLKHSPRRSPSLTCRD